MLPRRVKDAEFAWGPLREPFLRTYPKLGAAHINASVAVASIVQLSAWEPV
jgi:hypothetical protein